jgi:hypothetical protein
MHPVAVVEEEAFAGAKVDCENSRLHLRPPTPHRLLNEFVVSEAVFAVADQEPIVMEFQDGC